MRSVSRVIDAAIGLVSPSLALNRKVARGVLEDLGRREARLRYRAAEHSRIRSWTGTTAGPDEDIAQDLPRLRARSREIVQNSALAAGVISTIVDNVVGTGFTVSPSPRAEVLAVAEPAVQAFRERARRIWEDWSRVADAGGRMDFSGCMRLLERSALESGDAFFHFVSRKDPVLPYELAVEIIEADRVDSTPGDTEWRMGVKLGRFGEPIKFRVYPSGDLGRSSTPIELPRLTAAGIVCDQYFAPGRPGQTRGVPILAPALELFDDLRGYVDAEVVAARATACITAIVKRSAPATRAKGRADGRDAAGNPIETFEPGKVEYLEPGEEIVPFNPQRPGMTFTDFVNTLTRMICRAVGLPFELGALNFSATNYSSARAALLEARRTFSVRQRQLARSFASEAYRLLLEEAWLRGDFKDLIPGGSWVQHVREWTRAEWIFPGFGWVDPKSEIDSAARAIEVGLSTRQIETQRWAGREWADVMRAKIREDQLIEEMRRAAAPAGAEASAGPAGPKPLNGAQITAAIDVLGKLREETLSPVAATELLVGIGIDPDKAALVVGSIKVGLDRSGGDIEFKRQVLTALLAIPAAREAAFNATDLADLVSSTGLTPSPGYTVPLIPVVAPLGPIVSGGKTVSPEGATVGGAVLADPSEETPNAQAEPDDGTAPAGV